VLLVVADCVSFGAAPVEVQEALHAALQIVAEAHEVQEEFRAALGREYNRERGA
jgi:hypothetical protein